MAAAPLSAQTALDTYVYSPDPAYRWWIDSEAPGPGFTAYKLRMDSGTWRSASEVDKPLWEHRLNVYVPAIQTKDTALLIIEGGDDGDTISDPYIDLMIGSLATATGSVVAHLGMVPFQPVTFSDDPNPKWEDAIIAYTWRKYLEDPTDEQWPLQLPMTRAGVKAMDTIQDLVSQVAPSTPVNEFVVTGASKRGWTTWLVGAVENGPLGSGRVSSIIPIVIDCLNTEASLVHHINTYGDWSFALQDYVDQGVTNWLGTPEIAQLFALVDPYSYRTRLTMPKYIYTATGDEFFLPDSWWFYWEGLPGEKRLRTVENAGHSMEDAGILSAIEPLVLYTSIVEPTIPVPDYSWELSPDGTLNLWTDDAVANAYLWKATNPTEREFRYAMVGHVFDRSGLYDLGGGHYRARVDAPPQGWTAYFIDIQFAKGVHFTTGVNVVTQSLTGDRAGVSVSAGGAQTLALDAGLDNAGRTYHLLGSASGSTPGFRLSGQWIPLNIPDFYFDLTRNAPNRPHLYPSVAELNEEGQAQAAFTLPAASDPALVGRVLHHAFVVEGPSLPIEFASCAVPVDLLP